MQNCLSKALLALTVPFVQKTRPRNNFKLSFVEYAPCTAECKGMLIEGCCCYQKSSSKEGLDPFI